MAIIMKKKILGEEKEKAYSKTMYFATNFNGNCEISMTEFLSEEARKESISNGINSRVQIKESDEVKDLLNEINKLAYQVVMLQEEYKDGTEA